MPRSIPRRIRGGIALPLLVLASLAGSAGAQSALERGRYLVEGPVGCGNCHTPQGPEGPLPGKTLAGGLEFSEPVFKSYAANITPDRETGIGKWTDAQIIRAIREGKRPDGTTIGPPMPFMLYRDISDTDVAAIVAYLRTVKPVVNKVPKSDFSKFPLPPAWGPPVGKVADVPRSDKVAYGRYLAGPLAHCVECHSTPTPQGPDLRNGLGAGGMKFPGPWGESVASNITPSNLARYSDAELKKIITTGVRPDGSKLKPPMGIPYYAKMTAADLDAVVAYLRTLPRK